ncbi:choice-of-anchor tandem repeat GloVer-containing protein [Litoribacter populi]|uniref:choice-of-anchor tandem repeat GloVer-containing protein n=1 Tax=Litoribacter populi TaxID=2598460 RepID=UPI00117E0E2B|nr:choice-of-anchor tandem repeat GloVer-containing protein [Litoribacter populi]
MKTFTTNAITRLLYVALSVLMGVVNLTHTYGQRIFGVASEAGPKGGGTVFSMDPSDGNFTVEHAFELPISGPFALFEGIDGNYYGVNSGGIYGQGAISRYSAEGMEMEVLHYFEGGNNGRQPYSDLVQDEAGYFYGVALGGQFDDGLIFKLSPGGEYTILYHFDTSSEVAGSPAGGLTLGSEGKLYGANSSGIGRGSYGAIFSIERDGSGMTVLKTFEDIMDGSPRSKLHKGPDGFLYGLADFDPFLYKIAPDGSGYEIIGTLDRSLASFSLVNHPDSSTGIIYGLAIQGFVGGETKIFKIDTQTDEMEILYSMESPQSDGSRVDTGLLIDEDGYLYWLTRSVRANSQIHRLDPGSKNLTIYSTLESEQGYINATSINFERDGSIVGVGSIRENVTSLIFRLDSDESRPSIIYEKGIIDPYGPRGKLLETSFGKIYGVAGGGKGTGTIYGINADGTGFTVLRNLDFNEDGRDPNGLIEGSDGNIYGINSGGGVLLSGTIFKMSPDGTEFTVLRHLHPKLDGGNVNGNLVEGPNGLFYGVAREDGPEGFGSLFSISKNGDFEVVYSFSQARAGRSPNGSLTLGQDGRLYGFTTEGARNRKGYSIGLDGSDLQVLYETPFRDQGMYPIDQMVEGDPGVFYGVMVTGPDDFFSFLDFGLVFKLTVEDLNFEILQTFVVEEDGVPYTGLAIDNQGNLYGGTDINFQPYDPVTQAGVIFKLSAGDYKYEVLKNLNESSDGKGVTGINFIKGDLPDCIEIKLGELIIDPEKRAPIGKTIRPTVAVNSIGPSSATWQWGNEESSAVEMGENKIAGAFKYEEAGLYRIALEYADGCGQTKTVESDPYPVYDPDAGRLIGAGWFNSPQGAYISKPRSAGRAFFNINALYHRNSKTPSGMASFSTRDFSFHSTYFNWLVIDDEKAVLQGVGKVNGRGNFGILMSAVEGNLEGESTGRLRVKIWDRNRDDLLIYDNDMDAPTDALAENSIDQGTINITDRRTKKYQKDYQALLEIKAYPNPASDRIYIDLGDITPEMINTLLTDAYGTFEIRNLHRKVDGNRLEFDLTTLKYGTYYIRIQTENGSHSIKILKR